MQQMPGQEARPKAKALVSEKNCMKLFLGIFLCSFLVQEISHEENTLEETLRRIYG